MSSPDAGIDSDNSADITRKMYASLTRPQSTFSFLMYTFPSHAMNTLPNPLAPLNSPTPEQAFLAKNYDGNYDAPTATRATYSARPQIHIQPTASLAGSLGASSFSLLAVGRALAHKEGRSSGLRIHVGAGAQTSTPSILGSASSPTQHEVLQNTFTSLLDPKDRPGVSACACAIAAGAGVSWKTGPKTSSGSVESWASGNRRT